MDQVRQSLGLCPQHNMLFEDLTVREYLVFFGMLKGMSKSDAEEEGAKYIGMLNLEAKKNVNVTTLFGGMKRKVNLGIALIGNSKVAESNHPSIHTSEQCLHNHFDIHGPHSLFNPPIHAGGDAGRANLRDGP